MPDVMVFDETTENVRYTGTPHVVVEVLPTDRAADIVRRAHKYAQAGVRRCWIIDPAGPEVIEHALRDGVLAEIARHSPGSNVTLDIAPAQVTLDPGQLIS